MKKFTSFKSFPVENKEKPKISNKPIAVKSKVASFKEDPSFGNRLNFTKLEEKEKVISNEKVVYFDNDQFRRRQVEYNKQLRRNPNDVNLWLEFVNFQEENFNTGKKLIERKISILKKAIEFNSESLKLILEHLKLADEIEDSSNLMKLWEGYLKRRKLEEKDYFELSREYLNFRQKRFLAFTFDQVNEAISETLKSCKGTDFLIKIHAIHMNFLKRGGFNERIVALCQALIEINIEKFNYGRVDLEAYEDQWDFGLMEHIGDDCGFDWCSALYPDEGFDNKKSLKNWIKLEKYRDLNFWHPKQSENSFDLEGQVIFDDLKDFITIIEERSDILQFIKGIVVEVGNVFGVKNSANPLPNGFFDWYLKVLKTLLPFFKNDWEFVFNVLQLIHCRNPEEAETFSKALLSENRDSLELFLAYGRFQEFKGNSQMASKVYDSLRKRSPNYKNILSTPVTVEPENVSIKLEFSKENFKSEVYEIVRNNPGDKELYMMVIEEIEPFDEELAMEIFNLLDEQQLRLRSFFEEL